MSGRRSCFDWPESLKREAHELYLRAQSRSETSERMDFGLCILACWIRRRRLREQRAKLRAEREATGKIIALIHKDPKTDSDLRKLDRLFRAFERDAKQARQR